MTNHGNEGGLPASRTGGVPLEQQTTLASEVSYSGVGLHSGRKVRMRLLPAEAGTGIVFVRTDLAGRPRVHARASCVTSTVRATTIEENGVHFFTIEHLMSALFAAGIDNCAVELDNEEPPVGDGSALVFFEMIGKAGKKELAQARKPLVVDRVFRVEEEGRFILMLPYDGVRVTFTSLNPHPLVGTQFVDYVLDRGTYQREIAPARTIAYEAEVEALRRAGLGLGGTLENVIVYNDERWLNELRYPDELVRHKILDVIGDLMLAGPVRGHVIAVKSAHALNTALAKQIYAAYRA